MGLRKRMQAQMKRTKQLFKPPYKCTTQLGVILKREYPGVVEDKDHDGVTFRKCPAVQWANYFSNESDVGETSGDCVLSEFWVIIVYCHTALI